MASGMKTVLVLGGNGFIGSHIVDRLLSPHGGASFSVHVLNRGKSWEWDTMTTIKPRVRCITWDRDHPLCECVELRDELGKVGGVYYCVLDLSGYEPRHIKDSVKYFTGKTRLYIYISSDSVYEVCEISTSQKTRECDVTRPRDKQQASELKRKDSYGHKKLKCEEYLFGQPGDDKRVPFITLRLADVVGPRDSTDRFWQCLLWTTVASQLHLPVMLPVKDRVISVVYVVDIAHLVKDILVRDTIDDIVNQAYNIACTDTCTVEELFTCVYSECNKLMSCTTSGHLTFVYTNDAVEMYPSVERGPVDVTKATCMLSWSPRPLDVVVRESVRFYCEVVSREGCREEREGIVGTMVDDLRSMYTSEQVKMCEDMLHKIVYNKKM